MPSDYFYINLKNMENETILFQRCVCRRIRKQSKEVITKKEQRIRMMVIARKRHMGSKNAGNILFLDLGGYLYVSICICIFTFNSHFVYV